MGLPIPFGNPNTYAGHSGVDYPAARGTVFRASGHGRVRNLGKNLRGGYYIWVKYDGYPAVGYHHMDSHDGCPAAGTEVWEGTPLGRVGGLGQFSTGPHLHSEVEGYATTSGYWRFFDRNRVVSQGAAAGSGSPAPTPEPEPDPFLWEDEMIRIQSADRGIALIGAGYYRALGNPEEVAASGKVITKHIDCNTREFDLLVSLALHGQGALPNTAPIARAVWNDTTANAPEVPGSAAAFLNQANTTVLDAKNNGVKADVAVDYDKLAAAVVEKLPAGTKAPSAAEIAIELSKRLSS